MRFVDAPSDPAWRQTTQKLSPESTAKEAPELDLQVKDAAPVVAPLRGGEMLCWSLRQAHPPATGAREGIPRGVVYCEVVWKEEEKAFKRK